MNRLMDGNAFRTIDPDIFVGTSMDPIVIKRDN
jgi:hypothetical protein